jgi:hypothetical protein
MRRLLSTLLLVGAVAPGTVFAGEKKPLKPWTEWSVKEAQKILDDSPWAQTQIESDVSEMFYSPTTARDTGQRTQRGALNQAVPMSFRIRFLSAKPIRQAFARVIEKQQKSPNPELSASLQAFVERNFGEFIVVAVTWDARDQRFSKQAMQLFNSATTGTLQNNTYLEVAAGRRLFLQDYKAPISDGLGAKFIFARMVDDKPFVDAGSRKVRFYSEVGGSLKLNMLFDVPDMGYDGVLEY